MANDVLSKSSAIANCMSPSEWAIGNFGYSQFCTAEIKQTRLDSDIPGIPHHEIPNLAGIRTEDHAFPDCGSIGDLPS